MSNHENIFPPVLKRLRGTKSQAEIARLCGIPQQNYNRYEAGTIKPKHDALLKIATHFGLTVDEMLADAEPKRCASPDPRSRDNLTRDYQDAYDALMTLPEGRDYVSWISTALNEAVEAVRAFREDKQQLGQAKAYHAQKVFGHVFRHAEKTGP